MIFLTVGTQLPFDRLTRIVDAWAGATGRKDVFAQIGENGQAPENIEYTEKLSPALFEQRMQAAELVIAHAGMGTILGCMGRGTPLLILPRQVAVLDQSSELLVTLLALRIQLHLLAVQKLQLDFINWQSREETE